MDCDRSSSQVNSSNSMYPLAMDHDAGGTVTPLTVKHDTKRRNLVQRVNLSAAGSGLKSKLQSMKKSGKRLLSKRGNSFLQFASKAQDKPKIVKHFKRTGPSYCFKSDDANLNRLLTKYEAVRERYRSVGKKEMETLHDFRQDYPQLLCNGQESIDGPVQGVNIGMCFSSRSEMFLVSIHRTIQAGIDWICADKSPVMENNKPVDIAVSILMTGNYEDDVDEGGRILYCGEGGRDYEGPQRGEQTENQKLTRGNLALHNSSRLGRSVQVIRKHRDESSSSGFIYSYDGMYNVTRSFMQRGRSGYLLYMFELNRMPNQGALKW